MPIGIWRLYAARNTAKLAAEYRASALVSLVLEDGCTAVERMPMLLAGTAEISVHACMVADVESERQLYKSLVLP